MQPRQITHRNILRVLVAGFSLVILLMLAAATVGVYNIQSIQQNAANLVREQSVTNGLIDELHRQQTSLSDVFSVMARDPDSLDYIHILQQLDEADRDIDRISAEGAKTPERDLWTRLKQSSVQFSERGAANSGGGCAGNVRAHRAFSRPRSLHLGGGEADRSRIPQGERGAGADRPALARGCSTLTVTFAAASVLLALVFAAITIKMTLDLTRRMEWQTGELSRVSFHMLEDQEATARRFSHELHDELGQPLTAMKTNLAALDAGGQVNRARLEDCLRLADEAIGNVRQMSQLLRPTILDDFGLEAGMRWLAEGFTARTGIEVDLDSNYSGRLPDETETHLFRIAQEALTNVARHSGAKRVEIKLESNEGQIRLTIRDDGAGFPRGARTAAAWG